MQTLLLVTRVEIYGWVAIIIGVVLWFYVFSKRFNRRGPGGLQQYSSAGRALTTSAFEFFVRLIGVGLIVVGAFFILIEHYNKASAEKHRTEAAVQQNK